MLLEDNTDVFPLLVQGGIAIVGDIARHFGMDRVVAALREPSASQTGIRSTVLMLTMKQPSPGYHLVPLCLYRMLPGTTYCPPVFFAPNRFPGPCLALFARPWA